MSTPDPSTEYLLLFRNTEWHRHLPEEEVAKLMADWMAWFEGLMADGRCRGGQSLEPGGHVVSGPSRDVTDGPYAEAKESVAGYFILTVDSVDEALAIARDCPGLAHGSTVEVRPLRARCAAIDLMAAIGSGD